MKNVVAMNEQIFGGMIKFVEEEKPHQRPG